MMDVRPGDAGGGRAEGWIVHSRRITCFVALATLAVAGGGWAAGPDVEAVEEAIARGKKALLERISDLSVITYRDPKAPSASVTVRGRVTQSNTSVVTLVTPEGEKHVIPRRNMLAWIKPGHVFPEMEPPFAGGPSALVAVALVYAGVPTTDPTLSLLLEALATQEAKRSGTYVHSLRATLWSALLDRPLNAANRLRYKRLLKEDTQWLQKAMQESGAFTYGPERRLAGDNSNAQFANLGLWAGSVGGVETSARVWRLLENYWLTSQIEDGGWAYASALSFSTSSMTVAGCNSLYIVLDRHYARAEGAYVMFEGVRPKKPVRQAMRRIYQALERGDRYLRANPPNPRSQRGYELFGLERLGVASGNSRIGGLDWFGEYAEWAVEHRWGRDPIADAFVLIFLVHGRAPVLFQKLQHGIEPDDWNYYCRDLHALCRNLSRSFERIYRWQQIPVDADAETLRAAPILYISGRAALQLPKATMERIRAYVDAGGTVFLHADLASKEFVQSAKELFESMYRDRGLRFAALPPEHPVFRCYYGGEGSTFRRPIPIWALEDASRVLVFLCPVDIAGAWHQDRNDKYRDLFRIMANVRTYSAPPYAELPGIASDAPPPGRLADARGGLRIARLRHDGAWNLHPRAWARYATGLRRRIGIALEEAPAVEAWSLSSTACDVLHISMRGPIGLDDAGVAAIKRFAEGGGLVLVEAADGSVAATRAVSAFAERLDFGERGVLKANHPLATGSFRHGRSLADLRPTQAGAVLAAPDQPPPIITREIDGRIAVLACPFDLIAALDGPFIWGRIGYRPEDTERIVDNILCWRLDGMQRAGS